MKIHGLRFVLRDVSDGRFARILQMLVPPDEVSEKHGGYHPIWVDVPLEKEEI